MEQKLISIIIPVYNVEKYVEQCIKSVINQTYKKLEIILVDDGSLDRSGKICDDYAKKDKRIIVIHKKNGGLSDARNKGLDIAKGEYITFIDSDDYVKNTFIEDLYTAITKNNAELSICNINEVNDKGEIIGNIGFSEDKLIKGKKLLNNFCEDINVIETIVAWNKMYSKEIIKDFRYPKGRIHEDEALTYKILYFTKKISIINKYLYFYRRNANSITGKGFNIKRIDYIEALEERLEFFKQHNEEYLYYKTFERFMRIIRVFYIRTRKYINNSKELQKKLVKKYRKFYITFLKIKEIPLKTRIKALDFYIMPSIFFEIKKKKY